MRLDCVPLPAPGAPRKITGPITALVCAPVSAMLLPGPAAANASALRREAFVMAHDELRFHLVRGVHRHAHDDQQRSTAEVERHAQTVSEPRRQELEVA